MHKSAIPCPECKFPNTPGALRCLTCGVKIPSDELTSPGIARTTRHRQGGGSLGRPDPPTSRLRAEDVADRPVWGWVCCDPLPPIPIGTQPEVSIGRSNECDLVLPHTAISRRHALIRAEGEDVVIEDCSSNGTHLNGKRVESAALRVGDVVTLGPYDLEIRAALDLPGEDDAQGEGTQPLEFTSVLTGMLEEVPLSQTLQEIEFTGKSGTLKVISGELRGNLVVARGAPRSATFGDLRDEEAVIAMLTLREGRFVFSTAAGAGGSATMGTPITALLLEHSRRSDELDR